MDFVHASNELWRDLSVWGLLVGMGPPIQIVGLRGIERYDHEKKPNEELKEAPVEPNQQWDKPEVSNQMVGENV